MRLRVHVAMIAVASAIIAGCVADRVAEAQLGDSCELRDAYKIKPWNGTYIRCQIVPGTSLHADGEANDARFVWTETTKEQYSLAQASDDKVRVDGSSTVAPLAIVAAKFFEAASRSVNGNHAVKVSVGTSGTGGGFEKFCHGETDISNASRAIKDGEREECAKNGIVFTEIQIANDGLAVVVNRDNTWAKCLTMEELGKIWGPDSTITKWSDVRRGFPDVPLQLYGAGTDSGTFDAFSSFVNGKSGIIRKVGVETSEDDNVTVLGVESESGAMGYFGLSYAVENADKVRAIELDGGDGCVSPTERNVQTYAYPMARPLYIYAKNSSLRDRVGVAAFVKFFVDNMTQINKDALFVPLEDNQVRQVQTTVAGIVDTTL